MQSDIREAIDSYRAENAEVRAIHDKYAQDRTNRQAAALAGRIAERTTTTARQPEYDYVIGPTDHSHLTRQHVTMGIMI